MSASVTTWIGKLKAGESLAAQQLWERYFARLVRVARSKLGGVPKRTMDEEDVALSAFASFCQAVDAGRFPVLQSRDDLWQILVMHTARKAIDQRRHLGRLKRSGDMSPDAVLEEVIGDEPDPEFAASIAEEVQRLLGVLEDDLSRAVALHKLEGFSNSEIADRLGWSIRTVERKLALVRAIWSERLGIASGETGGDRGGGSDD